MSAGGALDSSVTLEDVFAVLAAKRVPLAPELAGYLVLEIAERANATAGAVDARSVYLGEEGTVALVKPKGDARSGDAEASLRSLLGRLLEAGGTQTPALAAASKRKSGVGLPALAQELESALIPVNRAAGRRALARLAREVRRVMLGVGRNALPLGAEAGGPRRPLPSHPGPTPDAPPHRAGAADAHAATSTGEAHEEEPTTARRPMPEAVLERLARDGPDPTPRGDDDAKSATTEDATKEDAAKEAPVDVEALIHRFGAVGPGEAQHARALKAMAGLEPTPPPPGAWASRSRGEPRAPGPAASPGGADPDLQGLDALLAERTPPPTPDGGARPRSAEPVLHRRPSAGPNLRHRPGAAHRVLVPAIGLAVLVVGGWLVQNLRPAPSAPALATASTPASPMTPSPEPSACRGSLIVSGVPLHAEVLLREGQAPVDVEKMPVGARLEFVATAEGYAPKRVVIPAGAAWESAPGRRPRFEAAVQLEASSHGDRDPWPAGEPGSEVGGQGPPGTVHVVATPRGAEIWMLAGIGPEARIDQLPCDHDLDVLVAGPTTLRKRLHVVARDFQSEGASGPPVARVTFR